MSQHAETRPLSERELCEIATDTVVHLPFMFAVISIPDCRFLFLNDYTLGFLRKAGLDNPSDAIGKHTGDILANWKAAIHPAFEKVQAIGQAQQLCDFPFEWMGQTTYWDVAFVPYCDENDEVTSVSVIGIDSTERKQALDALEASRERLGDILDSLPAHIAVIDVQGNITAVNEAWRRYARENGDPDLSHTGVGMNYLDVCRNARGEFSEGAAEVLEGLQDILNGSMDEFDFEYFCPSPTEPHWYYLRAKPLRDDHNGAVIAHVDITRLKLIEEALRQSEEKFRTVFDNAGDAIFILDMKGHILDVNQVAVDRLGYSREELLHMTAMDVDTPEYAAHALQRIGEARDEGSALFETAHKRKDGTVVPVEVNIRVIRYDGQPGVLAIARDITRRKQVEEELRNARDDAERERRRVAALESISQAGITAIGTAELLDILVERIAKSLDTGFCLIMLLDGLTDELTATATYNVPEEIGFRVKINEGFVGRVAAEQRTIYVEDAETNPLVVSPYLKRAGVRSLLGTPLFIRGEVIGVVCVGTSEPREFSTEESRLFEIIAARTAEVIDNAKLYDELVRSREEMKETLDREKHFSHLLQQALLPPTPSIGHGYHSADCFVPALESRDVGGDFYDMFMTEDGKAGMLIGDVSGKGIEAASFAAATRSTVRAFAYKASAAGRAVTDTNAVLIGQQTGSEFAPFVTIFMGMLDLPTGHIRYASAGHPPPAIYRNASGTVEFLVFGDPPVGLLDKYEFPVSESHLESGDKMILYTDGLIEARNETGVFGTEGLQQVLEEHGHLPPEELMNLLLETARDWAQGRLPDDTAIIVVERNGNGEQ